MPAETTPRMTLDELRDALLALRNSDYDPECDHGTAEGLLLQYIGDEAVTAIYDSFTFWYA